MSLGLGKRDQKWKLKDYHFLGEGIGGISCACFLHAHPGMGGIVTGLLFVTNPGLWDSSGAGIWKKGFQGESQGG